VTRQLNLHEIGYLGYTPFQILFGIERRIERRIPMSCFHTKVSASILRWAMDLDVYDEGDMTDDRVQDDLVAFLDNRDDIRGEVSCRDEERTAAQKMRYDAKLRGTREFSGWRSCDDCGSNYGKGEV